MTAVLVIEGLAILLLAVLVVGLLRSHAEILRALHRLGVTEEGDLGASAHPHPRPRLTDEAPSDIAGESLTGSATHVGVAGTGSNTLLAFLSSGCTACIGLWETIERDQPGKGLPNTRLVVVTKGPEAESRSRLLQLAPRDTTVVQSSPAWDDYGVPVTPYFVLIEGETGTIVGEGSAATWQQVESLIGQALADREMDAGSDGDSDSEFRADQELRRAGIGPGDSSLYPEAPPMRGER
jgi:hypothetical protein